MTSHTSLFTLISLFSIFTGLGVTGYTWTKQRKPGSRWFVVYMFSAAIWALLYWASSMPIGPRFQLTAESVLWFTKTVTAVTWLVFAVKYTGRGEYISPKMVGVLLIPAVVVALAVLTNPHHGLMWTDVRHVSALGATLKTADPGPLQYLMSFYGYTVIGLGITLLVSMTYSPGSMFNRQALALVGPMIVATAAHLKWQFQIAPLAAVDFTAFTVPFVGIVYAYALLRYDLLSYVPAAYHIGQRNLIDSFGDGVLIVTTDRQIMDMNQEAESIFGCSKEAVMEQPLDVLTDEDDIDVAAPTQEFECETTTGQHQFEITSSDIRDTHGRTVGYTLVFHDITRRRVRKQQLEVLNRVLRHNLSNDMTVVRGHAEQIEGMDPHPSVEHAEIISRKATELVRLAGKIRELEEMIEEQPTNCCKIDLCEFAESVVQSVQREHDGCFEISYPQSITVQTNEHILWAVLHNLVENSIEHNDADLPSVDISATKTDADWVEITVADNGPGIPEHERTVINQGVETVLQHGSSLGLWLVSWGVDVLGGKLTFGDSTAGCDVRIRLPIAAHSDGDLEPVPESALAGTLDDQDLSTTAESLLEVVDWDGPENPGQ